jgi:hypothetical protein
MQMFIWNNIFFSLGFDVRDHYKELGGDAAAFIAPVSDSEFFLPCFPYKKKQVYGIIASVCLSSLITFDASYLTLCYLLSFLISYHQ